jgi:hypothetical protein
VIRALGELLGAEHGLLGLLGEFVQVHLPRIGQRSAPPAPFFIALSP